MTLTDARVKKCLIITGLSGAGKTTLLNIMEDQGFYAVDNIPPSILPQLVAALSVNSAAVETGVAAVVDVRCGDLLGGVSISIDELNLSVSDVKVIFLDASDESLVRRFETTRRRHPLGDGASILNSVAAERSALGDVRAIADILIDTSSLQPNELREKILSELEVTNAPQSVVVSSFGFKNGVPADCDYVLDVRFLPNPNYVPELKDLSGRDLEIRDYLNKTPQKAPFMERLESLVEFVLEQYSHTVKKQVHIAIGCTGGRHRSVAVAEELYSHLAGIGLDVAVFHRDIDLETR
jgi:UPF0042 nucleotide-binding protein